MASFATRYLAALGYLFRRVGLAISDDAADDASAPTLTAGSGAPSATEPDGSEYRRTNGYVYRRIGGAWELVSGAAGTLAADTISEVTSGAGVTVDGMLIKDGVIDADTGWRKTTTTINNAALRTMNATPVSIVAAPGAGKANVDLRVHVKYIYATAAFDSVGAGDDLEFRYTDGSGAKVANDIETVGLFDQVSDQYRMSGPIHTSLTPVANAPVVACFATGEIYGAAGGGSAVVQAFYRVVTL